MDKKSKLTYYFAECAEFENLGVYYDNLTLQQAIHYFNNTSGNMGKGIGIKLVDDNKDWSDINFPILSEGLICVDMVNDIPYYRDNPLVQAALQEMIKAFPNYDVWGEININAISNKLKKNKAIISESKKESKVGIKKNQISK